MRKKNATSADALLAHVQPHVDRFARQLADTLGAYLNAATERVMGEAMERFENLLGLRAEADDADAKTRAPRKGNAAKQKSAPKCSACGGPGHNARSCAKAQAAEEPEEDEDEPAAAPVKRDRFAKIEAAASRRNGEARHAGDEA